jgi:hypothetical protein
VKAWEEKLRFVAIKPDDALYSSEFKLQSEELLDAKDDILDPVLKVLKGPQLSVY